MNKNTKLLIGIGAVAVVGYMLWKKQQTSFTGAVGNRQKNAVGSKLYSDRCGKAIKNPNCNTPCYDWNGMGYCVCAKQTIIKTKSDGDYINNVYYACNSGSSSPIDSTQTKI